MIGEVIQAYLHHTLHERCLSEDAFALVWVYREALRQEERMLLLLHLPYSLGFLHQHEHVDELLLCDDASSVTI